MLNEYIPDVDKYLDDFVKLAQLQEQKTVLSAELDKFRAEIIATVTTDERFYSNSKPQSMTYINSTYLVNGYDEATSERLSYMLKELANLDKEITVLKGELKKAEMMLSIFQTLSANSRNVIQVNEGDV